MVELKFLVRVPMDCWRQWIRHRTANVNEYSTRYSLAIDAMQTTAPDDWPRRRPRTGKGAKGGSIPSLGARLSAAEQQFQAEARRLYTERIELGIAREQARKDLPLSTYTEAYWKIDLHNLLHFLALRMDSHAQEEIRACSHRDGRADRTSLVSVSVGSICRLSAGGAVSLATGPQN